MNDICEIWNLPWQALQKNLALGLGADACSAKSSPPASALSWLGRARLRAVPRTQAPIPWGTQAPIPRVQTRLG